MKIVSLSVKLPPVAGVTKIVDHNTDRSGTAVAAGGCVAESIEGCVDGGECAGEDHRSVRRSVACAER